MSVCCLSDLGAGQAQRQQLTCFGKARLRAGCLYFIFVLMVRLLKMGQNGSADQRKGLCCYLFQARLFEPNPIIMIVKSGVNT